jgi:hypothetical protein
MGADGPREGQQGEPLPLRPAVLWIRVVSMASARIIAGRIVVSRRASIDLPAPGGPMRRTLCPPLGYQH